MKKTVTFNDAIEGINVAGLPVAAMIDRVQRIMRPAGELLADLDTAQKDTYEALFQDLPKLIAYALATKVGHQPTGCVLCTLEAEIFGEPITPGIKVTLQGADDGRTH